MAEPVITWNISADTQATMDVDGVIFERVVTTVHWRITATDEASGKTASIYGSKSLPAPTNQASYIDVAALQAMEPAERKATVIGWAETIDPGFLAAQDATVRAQLAAMLAAPQTASISIL